MKQVLKLQQLLITLPVGGKIDQTTSACVNYNWSDKDSTVAPCGESGALQMLEFES